MGRGVLGLGGLSAVLRVVQGYLNDSEPVQTLPRHTTDEVVMVTIQINGFVKLRRVQVKQDLLK